MANAGAAPAVDAEEENFLKETAAVVAYFGLTFPIISCKTLMQLGHEPFPLSTSKKFIVAGRKAYFLPNVFSYAKQLTKRHAAGWSVLMTGFDSAALNLIATRYAKRWATKYLDEHFPEMGGKAEHEGEEEYNINDQQSFRRVLRAAIRDSAVCIVTVFAARPFTVVFIRQLAQLIGGESKYLNVMQGLRLIHTEEGLGGLFSGVIPQLCAELILLWGCHALTFAADRALLRAGLAEGPDKRRAEQAFKETQRVIGMLAPHVVSPFSYPYHVVSNVMACVGSGLLVSFLPYNPTFNNWQECFEYLRPHGLKRAARLFLREQKGGVSVGMDKQLYASKH